MQAQHSEVAGTIRPQPSTILRAILDWQADMERRGCRDTSVKAFGRHAQRLIEFTGWSSTDAITLAGTHEYLAAQRKAGWNGPTHDGAVSALRCFTRFLHQTKVLPDDPLVHLEASGEQGGQGSRALTLEEARAIIQTAYDRGIRTRKDRSSMPVFVAFLCHTGLRCEEASKITWGDVDLEADPPVIVTDPAWAKNGRRDVVPIHPEMLGLLRRHKSGVPDKRTDRIFPRGPNRRIWDKDREAAGVAYEDSRGRAATYHSCRKYLATMLDRTGATPGTVARILRHAEGITQARYIDADLEAEVLAVSALPSLCGEWAQKYNEKCLDKAGASRNTPSAKPMVQPLIQHDDSVLGTLPGRIGFATASGSECPAPSRLDLERPAFAERPARSTAKPSQVRHGNGAFTGGSVALRGVPGRNVR